ncbi:MAG: 23S rRNA (uracil(1939)-C(5))-methyltransferase RlmD [Bacilli bacterium]|nr:23S rRNA (uracil(1939)-C(5))-methyltransferase RlmD [Bacilli bacterium]
MDDSLTTTIVEAIDLTHDALGVCKLEDGYTVFVEDLLKGESAEIIITQRRKSYGFGKVVNRLSKSPFRVTPKCKHFYECGGCGLMHMDYDVQLSFKKYRVETSLKNEHLENVKVNNMIGMINPYYYRNKVEIKFHQGEKGLEAGFFQAKSHKLVNLEECHIIAKRSFEVINLIRNIANELSIHAYDELAKTGVLKSAVIRESFSNRQIMVLFNIAREMPLSDILVEKMTKKIPEITSIGYSIAKDESQLSTDPIKLIFGSGYIEETIDGISYRIGFRSFFQTNTIQTEKLYKKALEYADISDRTKLIDAYCGIGSMGLLAARQAYKVFGIEIVKSAIVDAKINARHNTLKNAFFEVGDAETVLEKWKEFNFDVIIVDPPRRGCSDGFIKALLTMKIPRVVYVSCDQATLSRDLVKLKKGGYDVVEITPVDMFPQTIHVESVTLLSLKTA